MATRYTALDGLSEDERFEQMMAMVTAEYSLPDHALREFTRSRLSVWLELEPELAEKTADLYASAVRKLSSSHAMRWVAMTQTLITDFPRENRERLFALHPDVFGGLKEALSVDRLDLTTPPVAPGPSSRRWWPFGRKS